MNSSRTGEEVDSEGVVTSLPLRGSLMKPAADTNNRFGDLNAVLPCPLKWWLRSVSILPGGRLAWGLAFYIPAALIFRVTQFTVLISFGFSVDTLVYLISATFETVFTPFFMARWLEFCSQVLPKAVAHLEEQGQQMIRRYRMMFWAYFSVSALITFIFIAGEIMHDIPLFAAVFAELPPALLTPVLIVLSIAITLYTYIASALNVAAWGLFMLLRPPFDDISDKIAAGEFGSTEDITTAYLNALRLVKHPSDRIQFPALGMMVTPVVGLFSIVLRGNLLMGGALFMFFVPVLSALSFAAIGIGRVRGLVEDLSADDHDKDATIRRLELEFRVKSSQDGVTFYEIAVTPILVATFVWWYVGVVALVMPLIAAAHKTTA